MIERLESEKHKLTLELNHSRNELLQATELKQVAEDEVSRLGSKIRAINMDRQMLQQQTQDLKGMIGYLKTATFKSVEDFVGRLKLDLYQCTGSE